MPSLPGGVIPLDMRKISHLGGHFRLGSARLVVLSRKNTSHLSHTVDPSMKKPPQGSGTALNVAIFLRGLITVSSVMKVTPRGTLNMAKISRPTLSQQGSVIHLVAPSMARQVSLGRDIFPAPTLTTSKKKIGHLGVVCLRAVVVSAVAVVMADVAAPLRHLGSGMLPGSYASPVAPLTILLSIATIPILVIDFFVFYISYLVFCYFNVNAVCSYFHPLCPFWLKLHVIPFFIVLLM